MKEQPIYGMCIAESISPTDPQVYRKMSCYEIDALLQKGWRINWIKHFFGTAIDIDIVPPGWPERRT